MIVPHRRILAAAVLTNGLIFSTCRAGETSSMGESALFDRLDANHNGVITADEIPPESRRLFERLIRRSDTNHDNALTRDEFLASLVPTRPEKPIESKQASLPQADAIRYLLLTLDKNRNGVIEPDEVPDELKPAFEFALERLDANKNGRLDRFELSRGGPALAQIAARYVERKGIDVKAALAKLDKEQGEDAKRFDEQPNPLENLRDPKKARRLFAQLDTNGDGQLEQKEVPEPLQPLFERFIRIADRNSDGKLTEQEFLDGADRMSRFLSRRAGEERRDRKALVNTRKASDGKLPTGKK